MPELKVLYEDNHLLAVDKPSGLPTQPPPAGGDSLEEQARRYVRVSRSKPGEAFVHAAHRLDKDVSGIVLFACTGKALSRLNTQQRSRSWEKVYHAWVEGTPPAPQGVLVHWLVHEEHRARLAVAGEAGTRECRLEYSLLRREGAKSLLAIRLDTGRYHQIRAQLAAAGCPITGDKRYGAVTDWPQGGIALRHVRLTLRHPARQTPLTIEAPDGPL
jgi:23S rRNA pseudouridine1911/1915/1917 synthase